MVDVNELGDVLDPSLFRLTMDVVGEMNAKATEYVAREGRKYVPMRRQRSVGAYDYSGWPSVGGRTTSGETGAIAYGELFSTISDALHPFAYEDLETMGALVTYVHETPHVLDRVRPAAPFAGIDVREDLVEKLTDITITGLPAAIFDRAKALDLEIGESAVLDLYRQKERAWLAADLAYQLVVPLVLTRLELAGTFEIDERTRIEVLTDDDLRAMGSSDYDISGVPGPVADAAQFAIVVDMQPMRNGGEGRLLFAHPDPPDTTGVEAICEALRVVSSVPTGWARVFRRPVGWARRWTDALPPYDLLHSARRYPAAFDDFGWLRPPETVGRDRLDRLPAVTAALARAAKPTQLAARRLSTASVRDAPDDQLVDACIGLEALLGQKGAELSYRIALRTAALLSSRTSDPVPAPLAFAMAKVVYSRRSEIVHGSTSERSVLFSQPGGHEPIPTNVLAVRLLRQVLQERLLRADNWRVEDLDDLVLQQLGSS